MNKDLEKLTEWFRSNKLSLNISKTNYILFTLAIKNAFNGDKHEIILTTQKIKRVKKTKFWGIIRFSLTEHRQYCQK